MSEGRSANEWWARYALPTLRFRLGYFQRTKTKISGETTYESPRTVEGCRRIAPGTDRALEYRLRTNSLSLAQHHHDRAVSGRRPGRSGGPPGGAGAGTDSGKTLHRRQPRRRRRR